MSSSTGVGASLSLTRSFHASRKRVFRAWTDPEELKKWWKLGEGWTLDIAEVDLRVGGSFRIGVKSTHDGSVHLVRGTFREVIAPERLVYTWIVEDAGPGAGESLVTVEFRERGSSTEVVLTHDGLNTKESRDTVQTGWMLVLQGLQKLLG